MADVARRVADRQLQSGVVDVRIVAATGSTSSLTQQPLSPPGGAAWQGLERAYAGMLFSGAGIRLTPVEIEVPAPTEEQVLVASARARSAEPISTSSMAT